MTRFIAHMAVAAVAMAIIGCSASTSPTTPGPGQRGFLNGTTVPVDLHIDGRLVATAVPVSVVATLSSAQLDGGSHTILVGPTGSEFGTSITVGSLASGTQRNVIAYPSASVSSVGLSDLPDTGAFVPSGMSKVRVLNLAQNSSIDIWRTQPDYQHPIRFLFPFRFDSVPSGYFQSGAGDWDVWITTTSDSAMRLDDTGPMTVPSGERRTVVVVDSGGKLRLRVLVN